MSLRILVADDRIDDARDTISELPALLRRAGYEVLTTASGEAVYDLVILDVRFDGIEICPRPG